MIQCMCIYIYILLYLWLQDVAGTLPFFTLSQVFFMAYMAYMVLSDMISPGISHTFSRFDLLQAAAFRAAGLSDIDTEGFHRVRYAPRRALKLYHEENSPKTTRN